MYVVINFREKCADGHYSSRADAESVMERWKIRFGHDDFHIYETDSPHPLVVSDETFMPNVYYRLNKEEVLH